MLEKSGEIADARANYRLYLLAAPDAADAKAVREKLGALKAAMEAKRR
jgi:hypothetical protein